MANIGYARCSTLAQDLTAQRQALAALGVPEDRSPARAAPRDRRRYRPASAVHDRLRDATGYEVAP